MLLQTLIILLSTTITCIQGSCIHPSARSTPSSTSSTSTPTPTPSTAPLKWTHPGIVLGAPQLHHIRTNLHNKTKPYKNAYASLLTDKKMTPSRTPTPPRIIECGSYSIPDVGCTAERDDSLQAYGNALAWAISGNVSYAQQAIRIMDAYSGTVRGHNNSNARLQAGWVGSVWARAGELVRHVDFDGIGSRGGWTNAGIERFEGMLRDVYLPLTVNGSDYNVGNWELAMNEATIGMAVFLEDAESYNHAMKLFKARVPATIYMTSDGEYPVAARGESASPDAIVNYWFDQDIFSENGQAQETCRDLEHTGYSLASISHVAETARIQGEDLYKTDIGRRLRYGLEFQARFSNGEAVPSWLCGGKLDLTLGPVTEVGFNALSFRMGIDMPETRNWTLAKRPVGTNGLFVAFESLTHAQNPA